MMLCIKIFNFIPQGQVSFVPPLESAIGIPSELWTKEAQVTPEISGLRHHGQYLLLFR